MILIDAIFINNSGGKVLLDYLIASLEKTNLDIHYLLDERIRLKHQEIATNKVTYLPGDLRKRNKFYLENRHLFLKVLCFGNLPPTIRLKSTVYTYLQQKLFLEIPKNVTLKDKVILKIKSYIFKKLQKKTDFWIVQTDAMKNSLSCRFPKINKDLIYVIPFYPNVLQDKEIRKKKHTFVYVSGGSEHKNHLNLLNGFKMHYDENKIGELHLTITDDFPNVKNEIEALQSQNYPVFNHGFVERSLLSKLYGEASFTIYPSLSESFGLGIIEAIENDCKVIGADLPYIDAVCKPSLKFDPHSIKSIADAFNSATKGEIGETKQLVFNQIEKIIQLLKNENTK